MNNRPIIALLIIILIVSIAFNLRTLNRIDRLENSISNIHHTYSSIENRISNIDHAINNTLNQVEKEQQWIRSNTIELVEFIDYLPNHKEVEGEITVEFNEIKNDEALYLKVMGDETEELIALENYQEDLTYKKAIRLDVDENYEFTLIGETQEKTRSRPLEPLYVKNIFNEIVRIEPRINGYTVDANENFKELNFHMFIEKNNAGYQIFEEYVQELSIENAEAKMYIGNQLIETLDLLNADNWEKVIIRNEGNVQEEAVREIKKSNFFREVLIDLNGAYTFEENYKHTSEVKIVVEVKDTDGNIYKQERFIN